MAENWQKIGIHSSKAKILRFSSRITKSKRRMGRSSFWNEAETVYIALYCIYSLGVSLLPAYLVINFPTVQ